VRDLLRAEIGKSQLKVAAGKQCVACLSYVFNHHERELAERLTTLHHEHHDLSVSTMHAHLDHDHCLETAILRGPTARVTRFADAVCAARGVHHGKLNIISVELHQPHGGRVSAPHVHLKPAS
jgi:CopG family nickel-responsive transcriptional regulator